LLVLRGRGLSRDELNALRALFNIPSPRREECFNFLVDNADVVIEEIIHNYEPTDER